MVFVTKKQYDVTLSFDGVRIEKVAEFRFLGVIFDKKSVLETSYIIC